MTLILQAIDNDIDLHKDIFFGKLPITKVWFVPSYDMIFLQWPNK